MKAIGNKNRTIWTRSKCRT